MANIRDIVQGNEDKTQDAAILDLQTNKANVSDLLSLSALDLRYLIEPGGDLFTPPAYMQTSNAGTFQINSASKGLAFFFTPEADYTIDIIDLYKSAAGTPGNLLIGLYNVNQTGTLEPNGFLNGNTTKGSPTMTANNTPSPYIVQLLDSAGANAEAGAGYEAYKAMDGSTATDNGTRSNATPTGVAPIYYCLTLETAAAFNKLRLHSWKNASADVRAYAKAFAIHGTNVETPVWNTDADWTSLSTESGVTDPGTGAYKAFTWTNASAFKHYRIKFTDRNGTNAYLAIGEIELFAAEYKEAPGTLLTDFGTWASGSGAGWAREDVTSYQLRRGNRVCLKIMGQAGVDVTLTHRRTNTAQGSEFPDTCVSKQTTDGGTTWTQQMQDTCKLALLNIILNSSDNHCPRQYYGRKRNPYINLPDVGVKEIPEAGIYATCDALTADTLYSGYVYDDNGTLKLELSTTSRASANGIEVKSTEVSKRFVGLSRMINRISTYQGPIDIMDYRGICYRGMRKTLGKSGPYASTTSFGPLGLLTSVSAQVGQRWNSNDDFLVNFVSFDGEDIELTGYIIASTYFYAGFGLDGCLFARNTKVLMGVTGGAYTVPLKINGEGHHTLLPLVTRYDSGYDPTVTLNSFGCVFEALYFGELEIAA